MASSAVLRQPAVNRDREGGFLKQNESAVIVSKSQGTMAERRKGRPPGAKSRPKGLIPTELADKFLDSVRPLLPEEHYQQMKLAVKEGKAISTITEAKIMLKLMGPSLMRRLISEYDPLKGMDPEVAQELGISSDESEFKKDTNDRLKVWMDLLKLVHQMESAEDAAEGHNKKKPLTEITIRRGLDGGRFKVLLGIESSDLGGNTDGTGRETITVRTVPDSVSERQESFQDSMQEQAVGILDSVEYRDVSQG
jgi:hypothetical protein